MSAERDHEDTRGSAQGSGSARPATTDPAQMHVRLIVGAQHLYGSEPLKEVAANGRKVAEALSAAQEIPTPLRFHAVLTTADEVETALRAVNDEPECIGVIAWMHTFSPAKMWIRGLRALRKPLLQLHTQIRRDIPWDEIDMDYMNLNQTAHGGREFGHISARLDIPRKVVVGHWEAPGARARIGAWTRAAAAWADQQRGAIARFGDNMRNVAVTEGDKVAVEARLGYTVRGFGVADLVARIHNVDDAAVDRLVAEYEDSYRVAPELRRGGDRHESLRSAARQELGIRAFLEEGGYTGFTDTFEDLHGLQQLPGLAVQRLMSDGYGFGAEGDWKTAALLRAMKVMGSGMTGGSSFMEDYSYHFEPGRERVLGAHMLEICPSIAAATPSVEIHPLGIGGKADPVRMVFDTAPGPGLNASLIDLGHRLRLIINEVDVVEPDAPLPQLPVARSVWVPRPNLEIAAAAWIYAGGAHHTGFSQAITTEMLEDYAEIAGVEALLIDDDTRLREFRRELRHNEPYCEGRQ